MFDTHCHLNFKVFAGRVEEAIKKAKDAGVDYILVPGTDYNASLKAVEIAQRFENVYAAVGIHPHHAYKIKNSKLKIQNYNSKFKIEENLKKIESLLLDKKVVAVGEVGLDKHYYQKTKYDNYQLDREFVKLQKQLLIEQIRLAIKYDKSLILHNREATDEFLGILRNFWDKRLEGRTVFHCCEPDERLLEFAIKHKIYIGVDGDVTYNEKKQEFLKKIPLELLVLETDSPYLVPEPLKSKRVFPNKPEYLPMIVEYIAKTIHTSINQLIEVTLSNSKRLFLLEG